MSSLESLVNNYQPTAEAIRLVKDSRLVLLAGISGAGKDSIKRSLIEKNPLFQDIVSHTTRPPRQNNQKLEKNGVDYHFIDMGEAEEILRTHSFIEAKFVHGTVYGTSVSEVKNAYDEGKIAITDVDVQGVDEFKKIAPEAISIFVVPPDYETWLERLRARYNSDEEFHSEWPKRRASSVRELTHALEVPYYHFIINDDLERAVKVSQEIALREDVFYEKDNQARILARKLLEEIKTKG